MSWNLTKPCFCPFSLFGEGIVIVTAIFTLLQPNIYQSRAVLIPLGKSESGLQAALSQVGGLLPLGGMGKESPAERLLAVLQSRTLAEDVIQHLDLLPPLFAQQWDAGKRQ